MGDLPPFVPDPLFNKYGAHCNIGAIIQAIMMNSMSERMQIDDLLHLL